MSPDIDAPHFSDLGEAGLLCEFAPGPLDDARQARIWAMAEALQGDTGLRDIVPGMNNIAVLFAPETCDPQALRARITALWNAPQGRAAPTRVVEVPVIYGGADGPDLAEISARAGLTAMEFASRHAAADYTVYALGAQPGFAYMGGLPPELATPRRDVIHPRVEAGSIIIGGAQAGIQACTTPSGWHIIGRTDLVLFDPQRDPPNLLAPGDRVRFVAQEITA
ncbi:5-oxoprolinase subunit PxpB [Roseovarius sp.]|uniref:5-oxoprolinase subunit PxpB n=1 Tax=Roseovarius sp. TaxID=1486281 RepID=UPI003511D1BA